MSGLIVALYPRGIRTGGPEALHQLVDSLRRSGAEAYLTPRAGTEHSERVDAYGHYDAPEIALAKVPRSATVVFPEVFTDDLLRWQGSQTVLWWLSVDNSPALGPLVTSYAEHATAPVALAKLMRKRGLASLQRSRLRRRPAIVHCAQSVYAQGAVARWLGSVPEMLSDYVDVPGGYADLVPATGSPVVAFNGSKGAGLARQVAALSHPSVTFVELVGMTAEEVRRNLRLASVYLDLGPHPGKDRLPREAAIHGCAVLVAARGSAGVTADMPLPVADRVVPGPQFVERCADRLGQMLTNPGVAFAAQGAYREAVRSQRVTFDSEVRAAFSEASIACLSFCGV